MNMYLCFVLGLQHIFIKVTLFSITLKMFFFPHIWRICPLYPKYRLMEAIQWNDGCLCESRTQH